MSYTFYNKIGTPSAYSDDKVHIFLFSGETIGYISKESVYSYTGRHLGFFKDGWIRDNNGKCVLFIESAKNGPERRKQDIGPVISQKKEIPNKATPEEKPRELEIKQVWSELSSKQFFSQ
ncbi:MAG: 4-fold beta flower protein [Promethearchaeota archaeon]